MEKNKSSLELNLRLLPFNNIHIYLNKTTRRISLRRINPRYHHITTTYHQTKLHHLKSREGRRKGREWEQGVKNIINKYTLQTIIRKQTRTILQEEVNKFQIITNWHNNLPRKSAFLNQLIKTEK